MASQVATDGVSTSPSATRTLAIFNVYAFNKRRGMIRPRVDAPLKVTRTKTGFLGSFLLTNLEDDPITFTTRRVELQRRDRHAVIVPSAPETCHVVVPGGGTESVTYELERALFEPGVFGFAV